MTWSDRRNEDKSNSTVASSQDAETYLPHILKNCIQVKLIYFFCLFLYEVKWQIKTKCFILLKATSFYFYSLQLLLSTVHAALNGLTLKPHNVYAELLRSQFHLWPNGMFWNCSLHLAKSAIRKQSTKTEILLLFYSPGVKSRRKYTARANKYFRVKQILARCCLSLVAP